MLHVHRAERADGLVEALAGLLADPPADPFAREVVAVPTRGMERWLSQRMSGRLGATPGRADGVCANVDFPSPRRLVGDAVATASGIDAETDPWLPERAVWALLEVVDGCLDEPWLASLAAHLGANAGAADPARRARRFAVVRHLAELFDRYALHRPEMVRAWAAGRDEDGTGGRLRADFRWQAELWRRLRARIAVPDPAERVDGACARLRDDPALVDLPGRMSLFGLTRSRPAISTCFARWPRGATSTSSSSIRRRRCGSAWTDAPRPIVHRRDDPTATLPANRLLASWGQDAREMQLVLARPSTSITTTPFRARPARCSPGSRPTCAPTGCRPGPRCRSARTSARCSPPAIAASRSTPATGALARSRCSATRSCTSSRTTRRSSRATSSSCARTSRRSRRSSRPRSAPARSPTTTRSRCPSDAQRPTCASGSPTGRCARRTRCSASSRGCSSSPTERVTASQVLDLADREPVRRRFGLDDDDLARIEDWVADSGIRWGLDAAHRAPFKLDALAAGTWRAGLDRVLLGVTMTEEEHRLFDGVLPLDDVDSGAIDLAGRLAELVDRLQAALDALGGAADDRRLGRRASAGAADALTATSERDAWQRAELDRLLDDVVAEARVVGAERGRSSSPRRSARCSPSGSRAARRARTSAPAT